jgi:outer membrane cobalamin receptor
VRGAIGSYSTIPRGYVVIPGFGNPDLGPERWWHGTAGLQIEVIPGALELTADVFAKWGDGTAAPTSRTVLRGGVETPERFANLGSARVLGAEWWLRLRAGRLPLYGWISYTYQRAERRDAAGLSVAARRPGINPTCCRSSLARRSPGAGRWARGCAGRRVCRSPW